MTENPQIIPEFQTLTKDQQKDILKMIDDNLRIAGDKNPFQGLWHFTLFAIPDLCKFRLSNGSVWGVNSLLSEKQVNVTRLSDDVGEKTDVWNKNVMLVKLALEDDDD